MGLFSGILGNASKIDIGDISEEFGKVLAPNERIEHAYQLIRDYFVFTDKRLVVVNKQGITGSKMEFHSIPYKSVTHFSIETGGTLDLDADLKIWISSTAEPFTQKFNKRLSIYEVQAVLASYVLK
ncbi:PH domain-containing protein [Pseudoduganella sp.]|uniref:PH domain-containing protein n=1 Tax=Pseudoduganella sp. TaxID=1880898 RepID=UPI0035AE867F